jgi:hypothetical protein
MIGRTVLMPPTDIGERFQATIKERIDRHNADCKTHPEKVKFRCVVDGKYEEIVSYNQIIDFIEKDDNWDGVWKFREILSHKSKLTKKSKEYRGCGASLHILWENDETSWEPFTTHDKMGIFDQDPVTVALFAVKHNLIGQPGWSDPLLCKYAKTPKRIMRQANQAKLHSFRTAPRFMYGVQIPCNHAEAMELDAKNGNTKWRDAELVELNQFDEYEAFSDKGKGYYPGSDYKRINVHFVYAAKPDRLKARLVAGGHLTDTPVDSVYSSVVSLRGI